MAIDALYWSTSLVLNFEDSGSTTFTDISPNAHANPTVAGNAANSVTQFKTGAKSLSLDGAGDWLTYPDNVEWQFGSDDYCIEFWYRPTTGTPGAENWLIMYGTDGSLAAGPNYGWLVRQTTGGKINLIVYNGASSYTTTSTTTLNSGIWYHVACTRVSGTQKVWINGVEEDSDAASVSINVPTGTPIMRIGASTTALTPTTGFIDGLRITKGSARYTANFSASLPLALFEASAAVTATIAGTVPMPTIAMYVGNNANLPMPMPTLEMRLGGSIALPMPMPTLEFTGHDSTGENAVNITMPMPTLSMRMGNRVAGTAPMPTLSMSGTTTGTIRIQATAPMPTLASSVTTTGRVSIQAQVPMPTMAMRAGAKVIGVAPMPTLAMRGTTGSVIRVTVTAPMPTIGMSMSSGGTISFDLTAPMPVAGPWGRIVAVAPMAQITMVMHTVIAVTYEAYAVNLKPGPNMPHQVSRYTNFPFNQIVRYRGGYYGVGDDGLYLLGGDTDYDATTPTGPPWAFDTGITDFGSSQRKVVRETFVGGRLGPTVSASVSIGEAADVTYAAAIVRGATAQNHRVKYGRGLESRYWSFGLADTAGSEINIDTLEFDARETGRKL